jgi:single-strand DNA-binding protein
MASFNRVILMGNVTRDPQVRYIQNGSAVTELGLAVNRSWFDKQANQRREEVTFIDVTLWGRTAEIAGEYLAKGRPVLIEGRLQLDTWDDKESGQKRSKLRVVGETMQLLGSRDGGGPGGGGGGGGAPQRASGGNRPQGRQSNAPQGGNYDDSSGGSPADSFYDDPGPGPGGGSEEVPF